MRSAFLSRALAPVVGVVICFFTSGCGGGVDKQIMRSFAAGDYANARIQAHEKLPEQPKDKAGKRETREPDRNYILSRMRVAIATLADGYPFSAEDLINECYSLMTTQGVNEDKTIAAVMLVEDVRTWKGEPFEQAMAYVYASIQKAMRRDWGNARAAANESLFLLRDFGVNEQSGEPMTGSEFADAVHEKGEDEVEEYLDSGYQPIETNFTLGYMQVGAMNLALNRFAEARDNLSKAVQYNPALRPVAQSMLQGGFNTLVIVDAGKGPEKVRYGPDGVYTRFEQRSPSDDRFLRVGLNGYHAGEFPAVIDVNELAQDHRWNNLEDVRRGKSLVGNILLAGGAGVAAYGAANQDATTMIVGGILAAVGAGAKASARADIRHNEFLPQRVYMAPLRVDSADSTIRLSVEPSNDPGWAVTLPAIDPPPSHERMQVLYVRTPINAGETAWLDAGEILYANEHYRGRIPGDTLPYILGGTCVKPPTIQSLRHYQSAGNLTDMSVTDLENLYQAEGLSFDPRETNGFAGMHVLEGGSSMIAPQPGSIGYVRLFCQEHRPYRAKSDVVRDYQERYANTEADAVASR